jgi:L-asparaginase
MSEAKESEVVEAGGQLSDGQREFLAMAEKRGVPKELFGSHVPEVKFQEEEPDSSKPTIAYFHTGGTLMMVPSRRADGALSFEGAIDIPKVMEVCDQIAAIRSRYNVIGIDICNVDSKDVGPEHWRAMAGAARTVYDQIDGGVYGHGTHTLEYSAAAVAYAMRKLAIPLVFTASQIPILGHPGSDGLPNLTGAMQIAAHGDLAEVVAYAHGEIHRGTRVVKKDDKRLAVFESRVVDPVGYYVASGNHVEVRPGARRRRGKQKWELQFNPVFNSSVAVVRNTPGTRFDITEDVVKARKDVGLLLETYGSAAVNKDLVPHLADHYESGFPVFLTSTCADTGVSADMRGHDEDAIAAYKAGVRDAGDMTTTAAAVKLMHIQGLLPSEAFDDPKERLEVIAVEMSQKSYAGELTPAQHALREDY